MLLTLEVDRQGLHHLIGRLRDLGIELLELRKVTGTRSPSTPEPS